MDSNKMRSTDDMELEPMSTIGFHWVYDNYEELQKQYGGQWIVVVGKDVIAHSEHLVELRETIDAAGVEKVFIEKILPPSDEDHIVIA